MDDADNKLEIGLGSIYHRIQIPIKRCYLTLVFTENVLQGRFSLFENKQSDYQFIFERMMDDLNQTH